MSSVGGAGIPRMQDLSYLDVVIRSVGDGRTFEQIRRDLVGRAAELDQASDRDGSYDSRRWERVAMDAKKYVNTTVDVLKELMRLGWVERAILPSGPSSAYAHSGSTYSLTPSGREWATLVHAQRRQAYNQLVGVLMRAHPQFAGYLKLVGALPTSTSDHFTIPILKSATQRTSDDEYLSQFIAYAAEAVRSGTLGWVAPTDYIEREVRAYVARIGVRALARGKPVTRKQFMNTCEEAICRVAFTAAGCPIDYITSELLRRWTRYLGLATFSYYAPGGEALRLWATATVTGTTPGVTITRKVGREVRSQLLRDLWPVWDEERRNSPAGMYLPIWRLRAAACWRQRISDDEFDTAITEALRGEHPYLAYDIHLDQASLGAVPGSTWPLTITTESGMRRTFNVINITQKRTRSEGDPK